MQRIDAGRNHDSQRRRVRERHTSEWGVLAYVGCPATTRPGWAIIGTRLRLTAKLMATNPAERLIASWAPILLILLGLAALPMLLVFDRPKVGSALDIVKEAGALRVLTINGPTTYFEGPDGPTGLDYELAKGFADSLGVELQLEVVDSFASIFPRIVRGDAQFAAAGITITEEREKLVRFTPPYQEIRQQVVYLRGTLRPRKVEDLIGRQVEVVAGTSFAERLRQLKVDYPDLSWRESNNKTAEELMVEVWEGLLELSIADSNLVAVVRQHYPQVQVAFDITQAQQLAWAFPPSEDDSLYAAATAYIEELRNSGELKRLLERYYGAVQKFDYLNVTTYRQRVATVLPNYETMFRDVAGKYELDWRLLAAQAYQESQWDPDAVSPTGVKGLMQLTEATAKRFDIDDREDPRASIEGGARYLRNLLDRLPARITEPDRTWLALAAYNVGFGHMEDARVLTQKQGRDPDKWVDVKEHLPLLAKPQWYKQAKHGYARGYEAVSYVTRIRSFYDILTKVDEERTPAERRKLQIEGRAL